MCERRNSSRLCSLHAHALCYLQEHLRHLDYHYKKRTSRVQMVGKSNSTPPQITVLSCATCAHAAQYSITDITASEIFIFPERSRSHISTAGQPRVNRGSTADQPLISFFNRFKWDFVCSCFRINIQDSVFDSQEGKRGGCLLAGSTRRRPVLPSPVHSLRLAVRRPDPTGPYCVRVLDSTGYVIYLL